MVHILFKTTICYGELGVKQKVWDYTMKGCGDFDLTHFGGNKICKKSIVQELPSLFLKPQNPSPSQDSESSRSHGSPRRDREDGGAIWDQLKSSESWNGILFANFSSISSITMCDSHIFNINSRYYL